MPYSLDLNKYIKKLISFKLQQTVTLTHFKFLVFKKSTKPNWYKIGCNKYRGKMIASGIDSQT